jgi:predicted acetylornithine/succinylornithine family transaminase
MTSNASLEPSVMPTYGRYPVALVRGEGVRVWDEAGKEYLDFAGGLGASPLGHAHPRWREAINAQAAKLAMVSNLYYTEPQARLAERLVSLLAMGDAQVFFCNSGAEANEAALKLVRKWGLPKGRSKIVALDGSFHGRTAATLAATGQPSKRAAFEPLVDWFTHIAPEDFNALDAQIDESTAGVFVEPVLGEGGVRPLSEAFIEAARQLTTERGALLIADEVQAGMGRCGAWRSSANYHVTPDVLTLAKGLGGGLPIGATVARRDLAFSPGDHASTFGGGPLVCAAALETIAVMEDDNLLDNARGQGTAIMHALRQGLADVPLAVEVRGKGLLIGIELAGDRARDVVLELISQGMLATEASANVVRLSPPLIVSTPEAQAGVDLVVHAIETVQASAGVSA